LGRCGGEKQHTARSDSSVACNMSLSAWVSFLPEVPVSAHY